MVKFTDLEGKRVFVTGANGFIGAHLVKKLIEMKAIVYALVSPKSTLQRLLEIESKINMVRCDLLDPVSLKSLCSKICPQIVFHLASYGVYLDQTDMLRMTHVNEFGLTNLLIALQDRFECFINTGTAIEYGAKKIEGDLSRISNLTKFCDEIEKVACECFRILKPGKYCAILIGDTRRRRHFVPLAVNVMNRFLKARFILKEDIIKLQHNCTTTRYWQSQSRDFLLIMHEHLFVFRKPGKDDVMSNYRDSIGITEKHD